VLLKQIALNQHEQELSALLQDVQDVCSLTPSVAIQKMIEQLHTSKRDALTLVDRFSSEIDQLRGKLNESEIANACLTDAMHEHDCVLTRLNEKLEATESELRGKTKEHENLSQVH
jgi:chromosome segregation ATPase